MATERELELLAVIEKAPHADGCSRVNPYFRPDNPRECNCWKSSVDTTALVPNPNEWAALITAERGRQVEKGYDADHDREHGVEHLLMWAIDYGRRGERVKAAALVQAARDALAERDAETRRKALEEVRAELRGLLDSLDESVPHQDIYRALSDLDDFTRALAEGGENRGN